MDKEVNTRSGAGEAEISGTIQPPVGPEPECGYINGLVLQNFKSYAGTVNISPLYRFASVVGPNGSGKSNFLDALVFVIGVPHASLRCEELVQLIHPLADEAVVTLKIPSGEFKRSLARKTGGGCVTRYAVNGKCISQDEYFRELERDPGLYFGRHLVVTQGMGVRPDINLLELVETLANSNRLLPRYRALERKCNEAGRRLGECLNKRRSVVGEIKMMEAEEAGREEYLHLSNERDILEQKIVLGEIRSIKKEISKMDREAERLERNRKDDGYNEIVERMKDLKKKASEVQKSFFEKETEYYQIMEPAKSNTRSVQREKEELEIQIEKLDREIGEWKSTREIEELERTYKVAIKEEEDALSALIMENFEKVTRRDELRRELRRLEQKEREIGNKKESANKKAERVKIMKEEVERLRARISGADVEHESIIEEEREKKKELSVVVREILLTKAKRSDIARAVSMGQLVRTLSGMFVGGVKGAVSDLIRPSKERYAAALNAVMGAYTSMVVVDSEEVALECIKYVKEVRGGRLTFIILPKIERSVSSSSEYVAPEKTILARKCATYDKKYEKLVRHIFGDTLIAENTQSGWQILQKENVFQIAVINGVVLRKDGVFRSARKRDSVSTNALEELIERRSQIVARLAVLSARREAFADVEAIKAKISEIEAKIAKESAMEYEIEEMAGIEEQKNRYKEELRKLDESLKAFTAKEKSLKSVISEKERKFLHPTLQNMGLSTLSEYKRKNALVERRKTLLQLLSQLKSAKSSQPLGVSDSNKRELLERELKELSTKLRALKSELRAASIRYEESAAARLSLDTKLMDIRLSRLRLEEELRELRFRLTDDEKERNKFEEYEKTLSENRLRLAEICGRLEHLGAYIFSKNENTQRLKDRLADITALCEEAKRDADRAIKEFVAIKEERMRRFSEYFNRLSVEVSSTYSLLVASDSSKAMLLFEGGDPFSNGLKYFLLPPGKAFTEFYDLSGGERVMALIALYISLGKISNVPFFLFDEIDAALDRSHVELLARHLNSSKAQFLIVSLKPQLFKHSDALIGVYRRSDEEGVSSSHILTYRLR